MTDRQADGWTDIVANATLNYVARPKIVTTKYETQTLMENLNVPQLTNGPCRLRSKNHSDCVREF